MFFNLEPRIASVSKKQIFINNVANDCIIICETIKA